MVEYKELRFLTGWFDGITEFYGTFNSELESSSKSIDGASLFDAKNEERLMEENTQKVQTGLNRVVNDYNLMADVQTF